jgi:hypothetical protein
MALTSFGTNPLAYFLGLLINHIDPTTGSAASHFMSRETQQQELSESTSQWHLLAFFMSGMVNIENTVKAPYLPPLPS